MAVDMIARGLASKASLNNSIPGPKGDSLAYSDLTTEQIQDIRSGITEFSTIIRGEETKIGIITLFNLDYDLYQMVIDIIDIPTVLNAEATFTLSEIPLGFNLYLKTDSLVVAQESSSGMTEFYNNYYDISRLFVDSDLSTKVTIKCIKEVTTSVKATIQVEYIKDFGDVLTLDVTVPEGINPAEVNLTFPKLKYNKKNLSTFLVEDSAHCWNLFSSMNKKWVDDEKLSFFIPGDDRNFAYHKDFTYVKDDITYTKSTGSYPSKAYEYTDGAGIKHRYAFTIDTWAWTITQSNNSWAATVVNADELCYMQDFGVTAMLHDIKGVADLTTGEQIALTQSKFNEYVDIDENTLKSFTGRYAKGGSTAAGNVVYLKYLGYPKTNYLLSSGTPAGAVKFKPFSEGSSPDKLTNRLLGTALVSPYTLTTFLDEISANASGPLADRELNFLFIDRVATVDSGYPAFLQSLDGLIGEAGDDSLLFASIDEIYEYWFMAKFAKYYKTINGQNISYKIHAPCNHNFWFKSISCLLSGITSTSGITVTSSDNCNSTSFGISDNQLLINLDFSTDLLTKVEKYLTVYENNPSQEYAYDDALYFIQMLKPGVREPYQTRLEAVVPAATPTPTPTNTPVGPTNTPTPTVIETATPTPVPTVTPTPTPTTTTAVVSLSYGYANGDLIYTTLGDTTYNVTTAYAVVSNPPKQLKDKTGTLIPWYWELNKDLFIANAETTATSSLLIGADCGTPGDTGPYPGSMLMANFMTNGNTSDTLKGRMLLTLPIGTYKMKIVYHSDWMSTRAPYLPYCFYKVNVNGVSGTPVQAGPTGFDSETNLGFNAEIDFTVGVDDIGTANVALYLWNTYDGVVLNGRPGVNLLEIQKLA